MLIFEGIYIRIPTVDSFSNSLLFTLQWSPFEAPMSAALIDGLGEVLLLTYCRCAAVRSCSRSLQ